MLASIKIVMNSSCTVNLRLATLVAVPRPGLLPRYMSVRVPPNVFPMNPYQMHCMIMHGKIARDSALASS